MIVSLEDQLRRDEGWRSLPYRDIVGKLTIGYGRNLDDVGISPDEGALMLQNDIRVANIRLEDAFPWTAALDDVRKGVLLAMTFNMGIGGLSKFTDTLAKIQSGDYASAAQAMLKSAWASQVGARAQRLSIQMESGEWQ